MVPTTSTGGVALAEIYETDTSGRLANVSIRGRARSDSPLIGGFVLGGPGNNRVLIRAVGPTLRRFGVQASAADPSLTLRNGSAVITTNESWSSGGDAAAITSAASTTGAFALDAGSQDAATLVTLPAGSYTVEVNVDGGVVLLEIYEVP